MVNRARRSRPVLSEGTLLKGDTLRVVKVLARGNMSNVYMCWDEVLNKSWVLKQIFKVDKSLKERDKHAYKSDVAAYNALVNEVKLLSTLNHPSIPRIVAKFSDESTDSVLIQMDYVEGDTFLTRINRDGHFSEEESVSLMKQLCQILMYLHTTGTDRGPVLYRDLKPGNVIVNSRSQVTLLDFGISEQLDPAGETYAKMAQGSPGYAAPEQTSTKNPLTIQSDIFGFGATLYHMLTGVAPDSRTPEGDLIQPKTGPYDIKKVAPWVPDGLCTLVMKCTEPSLDTRYKSIAQVYDALCNYDKLDERYIKNQKFKWHTVVTVLILGVVLMGLSLVPKGVQAREQDRAYENAVAVAQQTGTVDAYVKAISMRPKKIEPYAGMINAIKSDGNFTRSEEKQLLGLINPNIEDIRKEEKYPTFAEDIGKLYWYYYQPSDGADGGKALSAKWFKDAADGGAPNAEIDHTYYNMAMFNKEISAAAKESSDSGMYKQYWNDLSKVGDGSGSEMTDLYIMNSFAQLINNYAHRLKSDGVPKKDVLDRVDKINAYIKKVNPSEGASKRLYGKLTAIAPGLKEKVQVAYR